MRGLCVMALTLCLASGCKKEKKNDSKAKTPGGNTAIAVKQMVPDEAPSLPKDQALNHIPEDAALAISADSLGAWMERLGRNQIAAKYSKEYAELAKHLVTVVGFDLLTPALIPAVGVDPEGAIGLAMIDVPTATVAGWVTLIDADKAIATAKTLYGESGESELVEKKVGDARVLAAADNGVTFIVRGKTLYFVISLLGDRKAEIHERIAHVDPSKSLAASKEMQASLAAVATGSQVSAYVNLGKALAQVADEPELIQIIERLMGKRSAIAFGMGIRGTEFSGRFHYDMDKDAVLRRIFKTDGATHGILKGTQDAPIYMVSANLDLSVVGDLIELAGADAVDVLRSGGKIVGFDPIKDLRTLFTGEIGFSLVAPDLGKLPGKKMEESIGGHFVVGVADTVKVKALLTLASAIPAARDVLTKDGAGWRVDTGVFRPINIRLGHGYLSASTDPQFHGRLKDGKGSFVANIKEERVRTLLTQKDVAALALSDYRLVPMMFLGLNGLSDVGGPGPSQEGTPEQQKLRKEIKDKRDTLSKDESAALTKVMDAMGVTVGTVSVGDRGLTGRGGLFVRAGSVADAVELAVGYAILEEGEFRERRAEVYALQEKLWKQEIPR